MTISMMTGAVKTSKGMVMLNNWQEVPLFTLSDDHMEHCDVHGDWCPNAYWEESEISSMIEDGELLCPFCMERICSR